MTNKNKKTTIPDPPVEIVEEKKYPKKFLNVIEALKGVDNKRKAEIMSLIEQEIKINQELKRLYKIIKLEKTEFSSSD